MRKLLHGLSQTCRANIKFRWCSLQETILPIIVFICCLIFSDSGTEGVQQMGFGGVGAYVCKRLQADLVDYFGKNLPAFRTLGSVGFLKWLLSPQNTAGFRRINVESIPGKKRGVAFLVDLPYCFNLCALNVDCTTPNIVYLDPATNEMVFDLVNPPFRHCDADGKPVKLRFSEADLMKYCEMEDGRYIQNQIARYVLRFEEALSAAITTLLNTQIGNNAQNQAITNIPFFVGANNTSPGISVLNPEGMWQLDQTWRNMGFDGQYAMIGGSLVSKIVQFNKWTSLNDAGVDMSKAPATNPYTLYDRNFNSTFGETDAIVLAPGATQLVTWNKYKGEKRRAVTNLYTKSTLVLPTTGLEVDFVWMYDYNCELWTFECFLHGELATALKGGCGANMVNVNGIYRVHDCGNRPIAPACPDPVE